MEENKPLMQIEKMDRAIDRLPKRPTALEIFHILQEVFNIDITREEVRPVERTMSGRKPLDILETHVQQFDHKITGQDVRQLINELFGINLEGIAGLRQLQISLYSKGQWIVQQEDDLIVVYTSPGDHNVKIYPTPYYEKLTGSTALPLELQEELVSLGFTCDKEKGKCYFEMKSEQAVPDDFKHRIIGAVVYTVQTQFA
ncbi:hypothetical protein [Sporosarcina sp. HYO08]|uniref:hypothetical protein n=1 Tax=Sporosarcina sp. HYO08 TaxID=1759557 RepID=UPI000795E9A9|nr:hypothetical protein [Sporosarcina sp. HYO08]KXH80662.1 hypothetical protein AU377_07920 [Sporosarcina sp. HYO08]